MRVLAEITLGELQRADAQGAIEHQIEAENVTPEATEMAEGVTLVKRGALCVSVTK